VDRPGARELLSRTGLVLFGFCVLTPALGEGFLRAGIGLGFDRLRDPGLYADPHSDDDYWRLQHVWGFKDNLQDAGSVHPLLGWAPRTTPRNPLGIIAEPGYAVDPADECVLFFGDSFVAGRGPLEERIPQRLETLLGVRVYNYGVAGYGLDQIFLRFRETHPLFARPAIGIGILTTDLDRSILSVRTGQKPWFALREGELELRGLPVDPDPERFVASHPPRIRSYFVALVLRQGRLAIGGVGGEEIHYKRAEKQAINRPILEAVVEEAARRDLPLFFVLFYEPGELRRSGWRERFLRAELERLRAPYLDTKELFLRLARERSQPLADFYRRTDAHPSALGNLLVAEALAQAWKDGRIRRARVEPREEPAGARPPGGA
jgi:hypothetical protein